MTEKITWEELRGIFGDYLPMSAVAILVREDGRSLEEVRGDLRTLAAQTPKLSPFTAEEKLAGIERELKYRRRVYPRRIEAQKMTQSLADEQITLFEAIAEDYRAQAQKERLL